MLTDIDVYKEILTELATEEKSLKTYLYGGFAIHLFYDDSRTVNDLDLQTHRTDLNYWGDLEQLCNRVFTMHKLQLVNKEIFADEDFRSICFEFSNFPALKIDVKQYKGPMLETEIKDNFYVYSKDLMLTSKLLATMARSIDGIKTLYNISYEDANKVFTRKRIQDLKDIKTLIDNGASLHIEYVNYRITPYEQI